MEMRARGLWLAMGGKRGRWPLLKALTLTQWQVFGSEGVLMGSGVMKMSTTKINDDACPPQVVIAV